MWSPYRGLRMLHAIGHSEVPIPAFCFPGGCKLRTRLREERNNLLTLDHHATPAHCAAER